MGVFGSTHKAVIEVMPECHPHNCFLVDGILVPHCDCITHGCDWTKGNEDE